MDSDPMASAMSEIRSHRRLLLDLLACIHGDGGHHTARVGLEQSVKDAREKYYEHIRLLDICLPFLDHFCDVHPDEPCPACEISKALGTENNPGDKRETKP